MKTITIFAKKRETKDGRKFTSFITRLDKKDGTKEVVNVKFDEEIEKPNFADCPMNIDVEKENINLSSRHIVDEKTGKEFDSKTLWVKGWEKSATPYVDTSLDDYEI